MIGPRYFHNSSIECWSYRASKCFVWQKNRLTTDPWFSFVFNNGNSIRKEYAVLNGWCRSIHWGDGR